MQKDQDQHTIIAFMVGFIIGCLLIWAFFVPVESNTNTERSTREKQAFDACLSAGGVPILSNSEKLIHCQTIFKQ